MSMNELTLKFADNETTLDRLSSLAKELEITPEEWVHRAVAKELGEYGLMAVPPNFKPKNFVELAEAVGIFNPPTR